MDCLTRLQYTEADKKELIDVCKQQYKGNRVELTNIREFQEEYSSKNALRWYTRESFFYKTLNAALRESAIHTIFLFRKYFTDIQHQLKNYQVQNPIRVYRCQTISSNELETLKNSCGQFISINSFFSTSMDKEQARSFLKAPDNTENIAGVLFEIDADPRMAVTKPFAYLSKFSEYEDEAEVLFMIGSIFRLDNVKRSKNGHVWIIRMTLCNDEEYDLREVLMDMKERFVSDKTNLLVLGKFLWEMAKPDFAEKYYKRMLDQLPLDDPLLIDLYKELATIKLHAGHKEESLKWRQKASELKKILQLSTSSSMGKSTNPIGKFIEIISLFH
jgi:tetratricopeptide (TPR) repeat protein